MKLLNIKFRGHHLLLFLLLVIIVYVLYQAYSGNGKSAGKGMQMVMGKGGRYRSSRAVAMPGPEGPPI